MSRPARGPVPAGIYHVYTRSAGKIPLFENDVDRTDFCNRIAKACRAERWSCLAFALLTTHYHLLLEVEADVLHAAMRWLNGTYAQRFNRRHDRWGHLFGDRYRLVRVRSPRQFRRAYRYVALNPVRAGLVTRPEDWTWSSYAGSAGCTELKFAFVDDARMRDHFGPGEDGQNRLRHFVDKVMTQPLPGTVPG